MPCKLHKSQPSAIGWPWNSRLSWTWGKPAKAVTNIFPASRWIPCPSLRSHVNHRRQVKNATWLEFVEDFSHLRLERVGKKGQTILLTSSRPCFFWHVKFALLSSMSAQVESLSICVWLGTAAASVMSKDFSVKKAPCRWCDFCSVKFQYQIQCQCQCTFKSRIYLLVLKTTRFAKCG